MAVKPLVLNIVIYVSFLSTVLYVIIPDLFVQDSTLAQTTQDNINNLDDWILDNTEQLTTTARSYSDNQTVIKTRVPKDISEVRNYGELNTFLCLKHRKLPEGARIPKVKKKPCPGNNGIVTINAIGRTGNSLWEYSGVMVISWITKLKPYVANCMKYGLDLLFENLTIPSLDEISHCPFNTSLVVDSLSNFTSRTQSIIVPHFKFLSSLLLPRINKIKKKFSIKQELKAKAQETLLNLDKFNRSLNYTYVAVHVRRTDYFHFLEVMKWTPVSKEFFEKSMAYFRSKYKNCLFVYISDDPTWCFENFGKLSDVVVPSYNSTSTPEEDLALMAACNHTIFDYGTYGEWGALLAGGDVIFGSSKLQRSKLKNWIKMG